MKIKTKLIICFVSIGIFICSIFALGINRFSNKSVALSFDIEPSSTINYNNFLRENTIDYKENKFCYINKSLFGSYLNIVDENNNIQKIKGITSPFQLYDDKVFYIKNKNLISKNINDDTSYRIAKKISRFIVRDENIIFLSTDYKLYIYNFTTKTKRKLLDDINNFVIIDKRIIAIDLYDWITQISIDDFSLKKIIKLPIESYPYTVMAQGKNLLFDLKHNKLGILDIETLKIDYIKLFEGDYVNNRVTFICDENSLYFSLQHTVTDGSIVKNINQTENGVWKINLKTLEKTKISNETFNELYLFGDNNLFGRKGASIQKTGDGSLS